MSVEEAIIRVCRETHIPMVERVFGKDGVDAVFLLMDAAKKIYQHVEPERVSGRLVLFKAIGKDQSKETGLAEAAVNLAGLSNRSIGDLVLEFDSQGMAYFRDVDSSIPEELAKAAVVYVWQGGKEEFLAGQERKSVIRLDAVARSQFAVPTLSNLREALQRYAAENVLESTCFIFDQVWSDSTTRLFLKRGPEATMRRSLTQFLRNRLGADHDVWPEQNVNEKNPVDIQVIPRFSSNRVMLIEIKWLGWSVKETGDVTARHDSPRAQEGAVQLAEYLDDKRRFAPTSVVHGYYVIIDCRRKDLKKGMVEISAADGCFYETKEIEFDPAPHESRRDFDPPYRMFARPICKA